METELEKTAAQIIKIVNAKWNGEYEASDIELRYAFGTGWVANLGRLSTGNPETTALGALTMLKLHATKTAVAR